MNRLVIEVVILFSTLPATFAQNARSWVASTGSDTNSCTRTAPCATFQGALAQTNPGGEIDVVDAGDYGGTESELVPTQAVTIDGGGRGSTSQPILVSFAPVTVRNLSMVGFGSQYAAIVGISAGSVRLENVHIQGWAVGVLVDGVPATITNSVIEDTPTAVLVNYAHVTSTYNVQLRNVTITNAGIGIQSDVGAVTVVDNCVITESTTAIQAGNAYIPSFGGTVALSNTTVTNNTTGLAPTGGSIISFVNNRIYGNGTNGAPTQSVYQK